MHVLDHHTNKRWIHGCPLYPYEELRRRYHACRCGLPATLLNIADMKKAIRTNHSASVLITGLLFVITAGCNDPRPDPVPMPDPVTPPTEPTPTPCEIDTADHGCISLERFDALKADLVAGYETDPAYNRHFYGRESRLAETWSNIRLVLGNNTRPGAGVKIGMIDDGIDLTHPGLAGADVIERFYGDATKESTTSYDPDILLFSHGTTVAGTILSNGQFADNYYNFHGTTPATQLHIFTVPNQDGKLHFGNDINDIINTAHEENIRILNMSVASDDRFDEHDSLDTVPVRRSDINAYMQTDYDDKIIIVTGTGNDSYPQPASSAALPHFAPELSGHYIAAMAIHEDGTIGRLSNHCGRGADWCIATPTSGVPILYSGLEDSEVVQSIYVGHGTSGSAAYISGSLALMQQMFRDQLSSQELVERLFATADKTGLFADSAVYGQGLVDLDAATSPVGELRVALIGTDSAPLNGTQIGLGAPFGDALSMAMAGREIAALDALNAPFFMPLEHLYLQPALVAPGTLFRPDFMATGPVQYIDNGLGSKAGHLAIADSLITASLPFNRTALRTYAALTAPGRPSLTGADLTWAVPSRRLSLQIGSLYEQGSLLGTRPYGAFGNVSTLINYSTLTARDTYYGWQVQADLQLGYAVPRFRSSGIISAISPLVTSAFNIDAKRQLTDRFAVLFSISQPVRIESGKAALVMPTGRQKNGTVMMEQLRTSLTPSGRQIDLTTRLRGVFRLFDYDLAAVYSLDPIHRSSAPNEFRVQFSLQASY